MANSIFKLVGSVFVDTGEANKNLENTKDKAEKTGVSFGEVAGKAAAIGTAVVAGTAAAVSGIVSLASSAASTADEIDKASIRMGVSAEAYQEYAYAAGLAGVETSTLEQAAKKLEGTGINFDDAINSIMELGTAEERSAKAAELFGDKVAYNLSPMIEQSADAFYDAKKEANDLGLVLSGDAVQAGVELNDTLSKVRQSFEAIVTKLGASLMPVVQEAAEWILTLMPVVQGIFEEFSPLLSSLFDTLLPPLISLCEQLLPTIVSLIEMLIPAIGEILSEAMPIVIQLLDIALPLFTTIISKLLPPFLSIIKAILPIFSKILDVISPILDVFMELLDPIAELLEMIAPLITSLIELVFGILEPFLPILKLVAQVLSAVLGVAIEGITWVIGKLIEGINWLVEKITWLKDNWELVWNSIVSFFTNISVGFYNKIIGFRDKIVNVFVTIKDKIKSILNGLKDVVKAPINWIIDKINSVFKSIGSIDIPSWVPIIGGQKFSLPQIPRLADGGLIDPKGGQLFQAREAGPELVGSYGSNNAVMNNDQIVAAVSKGVADAVAKVLNSNGLANDIAQAIASSPIVAQISADEVFASVRNSNREYVEMTGRSALA